MFQACLLITLVFEHVCQMALATVLTIKVLGHEDTSTTIRMWAFAAHPGHLVGSIHLVVLQHMKLHLLLLVLLTATTKAQHQMQSRLLLNVVVLESATILELLASENEPLLIRRDALLVLDLGLHGFNSVRPLNFEGDGLPCECLHKDLHAVATLQIPSPH